MKNNFKENEELDIIVLVEKIKLMLLSIFLQIFRRSKMILSNWKQLIVVVLAGILIGYIMTDSEKNNSKEAKILVKINFDAGNYIYDAIDLINLKILSEDKNFFLKEIMLDETETIDEILISTNKGRVIRVAVKEIRTAGRNTQGVRIIKLSGDEKVVSAIKIDDNLI